MRRVAICLFFSLAARVLAAQTANLAGEYVDEKFLNGHGTIHVSVSQKGNDVSVSFHGFHNDTPDAGVRFRATGKSEEGIHVHFRFEDTCKNSGDGGIAVGKNTLDVGIRATHIADFSCLVFYQEHMVLQRVRN